MKSETKAELAQHFTNAIPFSKALSMRLDKIGDGHAVISMPYDARFIGDPESGVIHGGAVSALMDTCGGAAVMSHPDAPMVTATLDLRIDYMRAATPGQRIVCRADCFHVTRSVAFMRCVTHDDDVDNPIAVATGAFTADGGRAHRRTSGQGGAE
ncbi:PaaI family thioesterase [uncultured Maritimibacter sp.]|uniref:PaaI family thioesterase n=1 Tax=uncultured Maritimibacter sp. TaxID=991866 RepID=UPI000B015281|nr:PaaI family thioesterase [uncultured Maritimibacter sp.]